MTIGHFTRAASLSAFALATLGALPALGQTHYVYGDFASPSEPRTEGAVKPWLEALQEASGGSITTEYIGAGAVVTARNTLSSLEDGLVDGALVAAIYQPSELPVSSLLVNIGAQMTDTLASTGALTEALLLGCPECRTELEGYNVQTLGSWAMPSYSLLCREPIQTLADAEGLRIRASGHMVTLAQAIGATPINLTITETFEALQRNQADCTFGSIVWMDSLSLGDVVRNIVRVDAGAVVTTSIFNVRRDLWQEMDEATRQVFLDTVPAAVANNAFAYIAADERVLSEGYNVVTPDADLNDAIRAQAQTDIAGAVAVAEAAGVANAQEIVDNFLPLYQRWYDLTRSVETAADFEQLLRTEIYANVPADF
ncbi:hypothetical protein LCM17_11700 [Cereibacter sphaeroides]|nr:hypothetical protein [Cereibacter sphaeroides]